MSLRLLDPNFKMENLAAQLAQLENAQLVRRAPDEDLAYLFKHALTQESTYESLLVKKRREIHRFVAQAYEQLYAERLDEFAARLAQHYAEAGDHAKTLEYATRAGDVAARVYANAEALAHYTEALALAQRRENNSAQLMQLFSKRGRLFELLGQHDRALANYDEMETLARARGDRALELAALLARATIHSIPTARFDPPQARVLSERSLTLARELNDRASEAKILWNLMLLEFFSGHATEAIGYGEQSITLAREFNLHKQLAYSLNDISRPYMMSGWFDRAQAALSEAQDLWRALDNQPMLADNLNTLATAAFYVGDYDRAVALATDAYRLGEAIHNLWSQAHSLMTTSFIYLDRGLVKQALETMQECAELAQQVSFMAAVGAMRTGLALTFADMGAVARAFEVVQAASAAGEQPKGWEVDALGVLALLQLRQGNLDLARELIRQGYLAAEHPPPSQFRRVSHVLADVELALRERDFGRAVTVCDQLLAMLALRDAPFYRIDALYMKGQSLYGQSRIKEAEQVLEQARGVAERVGSRRNLWRILAALGEIEKQRGHIDEANAQRQQALEIVEYIADHSPSELRNTFLQRPEIRALIPGGPSFSL